MIASVGQKAKRLAHWPVAWKLDTKIPFFVSVSLSGFHLLVPLSFPKKKGKYLFNLWHLMNFFLGGEISYAQSGGTTLNVSTKEKLENTFTVVWHSIYPVLNANGHCSQIIYLKIHGMTLANLLHTHFWKSMQMIY